MVSKKDFLEVGGMEKNLAVAYNDLDFCLKLKALGRRNVYTPFAKLVHKESKSRGYENSPEKRARLAKEEKWMLDKWGREILKDEYFNQNLDNSHMDFRPITHA
jgi:GT2 family glycosyltransferase